MNIYICLKNHVVHTLTFLLILPVCDFSYSYFFKYTSYTWSYLFVKDQTICIESVFDPTQLKVISTLANAVPPGKCWFLFLISFSHCLLLANMFKILLVSLLSSSQK